MIRNDIVNEIVAHADKEGSGYRNWYCGIASDPKSRLFNDHNVSKENAWWIHRDAGNELNARDTEECLLKLGFDGDGGGGDSTTKHVYAYRKTSTTNE